MFKGSWKAGITNVLVVLSDSRCRVFSIAPSGKSRAFCDAPKFALTQSWNRSQSCSFDDSGVKYFSEYQISGLNKCNLDVLTRVRTFTAWSTLLHFLEFAMNARFNINTTIGDNFPFSNYSPQIRVAKMRLSKEDLEHYILSSYKIINEKVYAPQKPRYSRTSLSW